MSLLFPKINILHFKYLDALQCLAIVDTSDNDCLQNEIYGKKTMVFWIYTLSPFVLTCAYATLFSTQHYTSFSMYGEPLDQSA